MIMKKLIIFFIVSLATYFSLNAQNAHCENQIDSIEISDGKFVYTWINCEHDDTTRTRLDGEFLNHPNRPNAAPIKKIGNFYSTGTFNCHGFAWLMSGGRGEEDIDWGKARWVGTGPDDAGISPDLFMIDGHFEQVSEETYPGIVFWGTPGEHRKFPFDHSAITTRVPGVFISKWRDGPLMRHPWNESPYPIVWDSLTFWVRANRPDSIVGPDILCTDTTEYILYRGKAASWSVSPNNAFIITDTGSTWALVKAIRPIGQPGVITAYLEGGGTRIKEVQACISSISGPTVFCNSAPYQIENLPHGATVTWQAPGITFSPQSQSTTTATRNTSFWGPSMITATITSPHLQSPIRLNKQIHAGRPNSNLISSVNNWQPVPRFSEFADVITYGTWGIVTAGNTLGIYEGQWENSVPFGGAVVTGFWGHHPVDVSCPVWGAKAGITAFFFGNDPATISAKLKNQCGWSDPAPITYFPGQGGWPSPWFNYSPNPVNDVLTIEFAKTPIFEDASVRVDIPDVFSIRLIDNFGIVRHQTSFNRQQNNNRANNSLQLNVSNLPEGTYYLHIEAHGEIQRKQIIINRK